MLSAGCWPVGNVECQVIKIPVSGKNREPEVISDQRADASASVVDDQLNCAGTVVIVFSGHPKQVTLVIKLALPIRWHPDETIIEFILINNNEAATDYSVQ